MQSMVNRYALLRDVHVNIHIYVQGFLNLISNWLATQVSATQVSANQKAC